MNILDKIVSTKREELAVCHKAMPLSALKDKPLFNAPALSAVQRIRSAGTTPVIAEFKRKSPSKGWIHEHASPVDVARGYAAGEAAAISVLTDAQYFGGSLNDLLQVRGSVSVPLLRKDFTIDPYHLYEARANGANIILLIAAILSPGQVQDLAAEARSIGLEVLLELHDENELGHICSDVDMVGINNRNLKNFEVNIDHSIRLQAMLPPHMIRVAESGIHSPGVAALLLQKGFDCLLMGEYFMKQSDPSIAFALFSNQLKERWSKHDGNS